jgi:septal ring factor EnvC (AmiA/AmiB activator)
MADWSTLFAAALAGGGISGGVAFVKFVRDEHRHRVAERAAALESEEERLQQPLQTQATQLGFVERATVIQQRAIESLEAQVEDQQLRYSLYKKETDEKIAGLEKKVTKLDASLRERDEYIASLHRVISDQEMQLRGRPPAAPGP